MQKENMLPRIPGLKVVVFCKRIVLPNETFTPIEGSMKGRKENATGVLLDEAIKERSTSDVASTYIKFIGENRDIIQITFSLDNCSGVNKNWYLYTVLANDVNSENSSAKTITLKYFKPVHTFMSADSFHHQIEQRLCQRKKVEDFQDFVKIIDSWGKYLLMSFNDFFEISKVLCQSKYT